MKPFIEAHVSEWIYLIGSYYIGLLLSLGGDSTTSEGMLLRLGIEQVVELGKQDEFLQVFILDQEQYEKIWKDKSFEVEIGPLKNEESKDISKGKRVTFTLPN